MRTRLRTCLCCHATYEADPRASRKLVCDAEACRAARTRWRTSRQSAATRARRDRQRPRVERLPVVAAPAEPTTPRECLACGTAFASVGTHHRICDACKDVGAWTDPASHAPLYW